jgi:hypothetical protein
MVTCSATTGAPSAAYISAIHPEDQHIVMDSTQAAIAAIAPHVLGSAPCGIVMSPIAEAFFLALGFGSKQCYAFFFYVLAPRLFRARKVS